MTFSKCRIVKPIIVSKKTLDDTKELEEKFSKFKIEVTKEKKSDKKYTPVIGEGSFGRVTRDENTVTKNCLLIEDDSVIVDNIKEVNIYKLYGNEYFTKLLEVNVDSTTSSFSHLNMKFEYGGSTLENICEEFFMNNWKTIVYDLVRQLSYLHAHNIIVNDIKPSNILVNRNGNGKIIDFGASTMVTKLDDWQGGTGGFRAPELTQNMFGIFNDVYSLGLSLLYKISDKTYSQDEIDNLDVKIKNKNIDEDYIYILKRCLDCDYRSRITASDIMKLSVFKDLNKDNKLEYKTNDTKISKEFILEHRDMIMKYYNTKLKNKTKELVVFPYAIDLFYRFLKKDKLKLGRIHPDVDYKESCFHICYQLVYCFFNSDPLDLTNISKCRLMYICKVVDYIIVKPIQTFQIWDKYINKKVGEVIKSYIDSNIIVTLDMLQMIKEESESEYIYDKEIKVKRNKFGNIEHFETNLLFDTKKLEIYGKQNSDGMISDLTIEDIKSCRMLGLNCNYYKKVECK